MTPRHTQLLIHIAGWVLFLSFPFLFFLPADVVLHGGVLMIVELVLVDILLIVFYYFNRSVAIPKYFFTGKYFIYSCLLVGWLAALMIVRVNMDQYPSPPTAKGGFMGTFGVILFRFGILAVVSFGEKTYERWKQTEAAKARAELSFLKAQINPHFLFNTLNSLYVLALKKSDSAPKAIAKLSSIMRYVIDEAEQDRVPLEKELKYISDYIDLQKFRLTENIHIEFDVQGDVTGKIVAPLVLLPAIENAFKHGVSTEEECWISMTATIEENTLSLLVVNKKVRAGNEDQKSGKGIINIRKRLELIYPERYLLEINEDEKNFRVLLKLWL